MKPHKHNCRNHLYALRRIRGLRQKQLARLLGYRSTSAISRLEIGNTLPPLKVALLMEIVLGTRLSEIYIDLYKTLGVTALKRAETLPSILSRQIRGRLLGEDDT
jgi:transcriptional regulator with XRE-family HTH domain